MKPGKKGFERIIDATGYSMQGIQHCWKNESAFRQEVGLACILLPCAFFVGNSPAEIAVLLMTLFLVLIAEILNSAIEAIVDKTSPELHPLAGAAKDCGSAAVFFALVATVAIWGIIIIANI